MAYCQNCGTELPEGATFCTSCGTPVGAQPQPQQGIPMPVVTAPVGPAPTDHTAEFDAKDISENKVMAMSAYLLGYFGILIAVLAAQNSPYAHFHVRQALKLELVSTLLLIVMLVLFWTFIVPILGALCVLVLFVLRIICFFQVCSGKAKDIPLVGALPFLK